MPCPMTSIKQTCSGLLFVLAAASVGLSVPRNAPAQPPTQGVDWTIDITFALGTGGQPDSVTYGFKSNPPVPLPPSPNCSEGPVYPANPHKGDLHVCWKDRVKWIVHTGGKAHLVIFQPDLILGDKNDVNGTPILDADEGKPTVGGKVLRDNITGEYYVTAYDQNTGHFFRDDPQIIVGTGDHLKKGPDKK